MDLTFAVPVLCSLSAFFLDAVNAQMGGFMNGMMGGNMGGGMGGNMGRSMNSYSGGDSSNSYGGGGGSYGGGSSNGGYGSSGSSTSGSTSKGRGVDWDEKYLTGYPIQGGLFPAVGYPFWPGIFGFGWPFIYGGYGGIHGFYGGQGY